jgi:hypothetical protein
LRRSRVWFCEVFTLRKSRMAIFKAENSFVPTAMTTGAGHSKVDLMLDISSLREQHSGALVLKGKLATDREIDAAIDELNRDLEALRAAAKQKLKSSR